MYNENVLKKNKLFNMKFEISIASVVINFIIFIISIVMIIISFSSYDTFLFFFGSVLLLTYFTKLIYIITLTFTTRLEIKDNVIIGTVGFFKIKTLHSNIGNQMSVSIQQSILGRIFNYGDIIITTLSSQYRFRYLNNPKKILVLINDIESNNNK